MEIRFTPFLYVVSVTFSAIQAVYLGLKLHQHHRKKEGSMQSMNFIRQVIVAGLLITTVLFNIYNLGGMLVGYSQGFVNYRSMSPTAYEKVLQVLEVLFDSVQKSTLLLSTMLFLPVLYDINQYFGDEKPPKSFKEFVVTFSLLRILVYPMIYAVMRSNIDAALYSIDILSTAESCFFIYMFLGIYYRYRRVLEEDNVLHRFRKMIFESKIKDLRVMLGLLSMQLLIDTFYKAMAIITAFTQQSVLKYLILDYAYLLRLISLTLQFYCILKICIVEESTMHFQKSLCLTKEAAGRSEGEDVDGVMEPKSYHYFTQPNSGNHDNYSEKRFSLF